MLRMEIPRFAQQISGPGYVLPIPRCRAPLTKGLLLRHVRSDPTRPASIRLHPAIPAEAGIQVVAINRKKRRHSSESWNSA
jgi:hypothetical protein